MADSIDNTQDMIDSRDVIARIDELSARRDDDEQTYPLDADERAELTALESLAEQAEGYAPDWQYGAQLIRDSYFEDYAQELAADIGAIQDDAKWPATCIDWEQAARELQMDYTEVEFDGVAYWVR